MGDVRAAPKDSNDSLAEGILKALDLLDQSFAQFPESRTKDECFDLLMQLRFKAREATKEFNDTGVNRT